MKMIALAFTLKGQNFSEIKKVLADLRPKIGPAVLVHGFMPRELVVKQGFSTDLVDTLEEMFPFQLNLFADGAPLRKDMAELLKQAGAQVYVIGEVKDGVAEEVGLYQANRIQVSFLPLGWNGNLISRPLTYGEKAVGLTFNHGEGPIFHQVSDAKNVCAKAIDQMNDLRELSASGEYKALSTIAIRKLQSAQMDMVKAITWRD